MFISKLAKNETTYLMTTYYGLTNKLDKKKSRAGGSIEATKEHHSR
jgi:hypothetical protein